MRAGIALGSNLGERLTNLKIARGRVCALSRAELPWLASAIYETEPVDCAEDAPQFLNAVMEIGYASEPQSLLAELREIEIALGRPRKHPRNAARTLDLDLLYFGDEIIATSELELTHPRMHTRRFVLEPLAEIRPDLILPGQTETVSGLLAKLPTRAPLVRVTSEW
ncbi:MAG: 2-amino-4-hydroxy-6-hydroxymethyldihydropteridine diphosphokinase [Chthoniobacterales bacterium]